MYETGKEAILRPWIIVPPKNICVPVKLNEQQINKVTLNNARLNITSLSDRLWLNLFLRIVVAFKKAV